jgi:hypothetical protein
MPNRTYNYKYTDLRFVFALFGSFFSYHLPFGPNSVLNSPLPHSNDLTLGAIMKFQNEAMKHENGNTSAFPILTELLLICSRRTLLIVSEMYRVVLQYSFV